MLYGFIASLFYYAQTSQVQNGPTYTSTSGILYRTKACMGDMRNTYAVLSLRRRDCDSIKKQEVLERTNLPTFLTLFKNAV
jgi:hypothetical protein